MTHSCKRRSGQVANTFYFYASLGISGAHDGVHLLEFILGILFTRINLDILIFGDICAVKDCQL